MRRKSNGRKTWRGSKSRRSEPQRWTPQEDIGSRYGDVNQSGRRNYDEGSSRDENNLQYNEREWLTGNQAAASRNYSNRTDDFNEFDDRGNQRTPQRNIEHPPMRDYREYEDDYGRGSERGHFMQRGNREEREEGDYYQEPRPEQRPGRVKPEWVGPQWSETPEWQEPGRRSGGREFGPNGPGYDPGSRGFDQGSRGGYDQGSRGGRSTRG